MWNCSNYSITGFFVSNNRLIWPVEISFTFTKVCHLQLAIWADLFQKRHHFRRTRRNPFTWCRCIHCWSWKYVICNTDQSSSEQLLNATIKTFQKSDYKKPSLYALLSEEYRAFKKFDKRTKNVDLLYVNGFFLVQATLRTKQEIDWAPQNLMLLYFSSIIWEKYFL